MERTRNRALGNWMAEHVVTSIELADQVNAALEQLTGRRGRTSDRTVFRWLSGETPWPQARQRKALQMVTGRSPTALGFVPRTTGEEEDEVRRRRFVTAVGGSALPTGAAVGMSDVRLLRARVDALADHDDAHGGSRSLEEKALRRVDQAHELLQRTVASARVRGKLYALAADATTTAAWAAIDTHSPVRATVYLHRALALAGMAHDADAELRAWHNISMLATQQDRHTDALAAAEAARTSRAAARDPLYASLAHARTASCHARTGNRQAVLRSLGYAERSFTRADTTAWRPGWLRFYDTAELHGLAAVFHQRLGQYDLAEYRAHHALAQLHPDLVRNRIYYTATLALSQAAQRNIEQACATADQALAMAGPAPASARIRTLLGQFRTRLSALAPYEPAAADWLHRTAPPRPGRR
ncbi:hypothetical protein [Streptomyces sp. WAC 06783]|uniref:hypothetical protein n=1 Tax=Streptomyces sp. WAC 06783 TaxID=2203211 RepID=UPI00163CBFFC|nr:hypothetical protein [Streptomyces sp. WAC 06783]